MRYDTEYINAIGQEQKKENIKFLNIENNVLCALLYFIKREVKATPETAQIVDHICNLNAENLKDIKSLKEALNIE